MSYPLIKKWLGLEIIIEYGGDVYCYVDADDLEAKLAEGVELIQSNYCSDNEWTTHDEILGGKNGRENIATHKCLAIGKQPIKKQTQMEAALKFLYELSQMPHTTIANEYYASMAKKILEMKDE